MSIDSGLTNNAKSEAVTAARRVTKNTAWLFAQNILDRLLSLALIIYLARSLGDVAYGKLAFAMAFVHMFTMFTDLGLNMLILRDVSRDRRLAPDYIGSGLLLKIALYLAIFAILITAANLFRLPPETKNVVYLVALYFLLYSAGGFLRIVFQAHERMVYAALVEASHRLVLFALCVVAITLGGGLLSVASMYAIVGVLHLLASLLFCIFKFTKLKLRIDFRFWGDLLRRGLPFALGGILLVAFYNADILILTGFKGAQVTGWYAAGYGLFINLGIISSALLSAAFPAMTRFFREGKDEFRKIYEMTFKMLFLIGLPLTVGGALLGERLAILIYGELYAATGLALKILSWGVVLAFLGSLYGHLLAAIGKELDNTKLFGGAVGLNVILNLALIPKFSYVGAALATLISEIVLIGSYIWYLQGTPHRYFPIRFIIKSGLSCILMWAILYTFWKINVVALVLVAGTAYLLAIILSGALSRQERQLLRQIVIFEKVEG